MLRNNVKESAAAPGTGTTVTLSGAQAGYSSFTGFGNGASCYYILTDGAQSELQAGTVTVGSPNTLSRGASIWNSAGTQPSRLNFTGTTTVYNALPAERAMYADASSVWQGQSRRLTGIADATGATDAVNFQQLAWDQIGAATNAGTTTVVQYTLPSAYSRFRVEWSANSTSGGGMFARFSNDSGATYRSGASDYSYAAGYVRAASVISAGSGGTTYIPLSDNPAAGGFIMGWLEFDAAVGAGLVDAFAIASGTTQSRYTAQFSSAFATYTNVQLGVVGSTFSAVRMRLLGGF